MTTSALPVLIARPGTRAQALVDIIERQGFSVQHLNVMTLEPLEPTAKMRGVLYDLDMYAHVICTSPFAAQCLADSIETYWPQLPIGVAFYATGISTAEVLGGRLGVRVHCPAPGSGSASEALLSLGRLREVDAAQVLIVSGEGGRDLLRTTLESRGATVTTLPLYRRRLHAPDDEGLMQLQHGGFAALIVTSAEQLDHLAQWCGAPAKRRVLIVSSQRLATLAQTYGFSRISIAGDATPATLGATVASACSKAASASP
ncbi:uroporphyrinogen-III synthase [Phytohalomonas tamaricis]|uniref:uroporphyrinogen-III synthase n=1 Tax=Phytohalomonas tamaricis TaxID=2081032 RepID=UPI000D0ABC7E|nr:uroporphyrinogen-III synthase [Phytohalomonas tamaricis]